MIPYGEYLEMVEFTPDGRLRFDLLLDELLPLVSDPDGNSSGPKILGERLKNLLELADPRDLDILRRSGVWRAIEEGLGRRIP